MMHNRPETDSDLIRACRNGDAQAWERLLAAYERLVFSIPLSYGLSREDAADITQQTFIALLQSIDTLQENSRLSAWLGTVARRSTWRVIQQRRRESDEPLDELEERLIQPGRVGEGIERWEMVERLHVGLAALTSRCQELLTALYFDAEEPSYAEVAARLGLPLGSIGPTRARCLQRLRQALGPLG